MKTEAGSWNVIRLQEVGKLFESSKNMHAGYIENFVESEAGVLSSGDST